MLPVLIATLMGILFRSVYCTDSNINYFLAWIIIGVPFGIKRMWAWLVPLGHDLGATIGIIFFNVLVGGLIGGGVFILQLVSGIIKLIKGR